MKAKDIALLCVGAAAGAAAGSAAAGSAAAKASGSKKAKAPASHAVKPAPEKKEKKTSPAKVSAKTAELPDGVSAVFFAESDSGITAVSNDGRKAFRIDGQLCASEIRCPSGITGAAASEECTVFLTKKGGVFVYGDRDREPVLCGITAPDHVCCFGGMFYIFSDCLLYICKDDGNIGKTVSLGAMIDLTTEDICDAENSDSSFAEARVSVKKAIPLGRSELAAVLTDDGRSFIMNRDGSFCGFEKTYENIKDMCVYGDFAYYLCQMSDGWGIIKTAISKRTCRTAGKYRLCGKEKTPVSIFSAPCGIGALFDDGQIKLYLPEIKSAAAREKAKIGLAALNAALGEVKAEKVFPAGNSLCVAAGGKLTAYTIVG